MPNFTRLLDLKLSLAVQGTSLLLSAGTTINEKKILHTLKTWRNNRWKE
jgi:hypothetical protein